MRIKNRWLVLIGAISAQMAIGAIYAWSLFNEHFANAFETGTTQIYTTYSIAIFMFAFATLFAGRLQIKKGPRITALIGGLLYSGGVFLSAFATSPTMLYITYGVLAGAGVGFVYVVPLATLIKWFPKQKGTITGLAVSAFALGGLVFKEVATYLLGETPTVEVLSSTFMTLGVIYFVMTMVGALLLNNPENFEIKKANGTDNDLTSKEMLKTSSFYKVFISYLLAVMPGLLIIGLAKNIGLELVKLDTDTAAFIVGVIALVNAGGRLLSGFLADKLGANRVLKGMYLVTIVSLAILSFVELNYTIFLVAILGVVCGYGSFLALFPNIVSTKFGQTNYSANYGLVYQAYGIAGLIGPIIKKNTATFEQTFMISMVAAVIGLVVFWSIKEKSN